LFARLSDESLKKSLFSIDMISGNTLQRKYSAYKLCTFEVLVCWLLNFSRRISSFLNFQKVSDRLCSLLSERNLWSNLK
jgi:hypothetical protein